MVIGREKLQAEVILSQREEGRKELNIENNIAAPPPKARDPCPNLLALNLTSSIVSMTMQKMSTLKKTFKGSLSPSSKTQIMSKRKFCPTPLTFNQGYSST